MWSQIYNRIFRYPCNSRFLAFLVVIVGLLVISGWHFREATLIQIHPDFVPMQYNTALGFLLTALSVLFLTYGRHIPSLISSALVFLLSGLTLLEYINGINFGIDEMFMDHYITTNSPNPGRMSLNTALCFSVISITIFFAAIKTSALYIMMALPLGAFVSAIGLVSLIGYSTGLDTSYAWAEGLSAMAVHTSFCFLLLGLSVILIYTSKHIKATNWAFCLSSFTMMFFTFMVLSIYTYFTKHEIQLIEQLTAINAIDEATIDDFYTFHTSEIFLTTSLILALFLSAFVYAAVITFNQSRAIKIQARNLKVANEELEEFAYRTSHDLRAPLLSSIKLLEMADDYLEKGDREKYKELTAVSKNGLLRLELLVTDILTLARTKNAQEDTQEINMPELVDEIFEKLSHMDQFDNLKIRKNIQPNLNVNQQKYRLTLIVENLISNAIKYQDTSKEKSWLDVTIKQQSNNIVITITDNGLGIPAQYRDKIFNMFERFHSKTSYGSGLGLYMIRKSVDMLNGTIQYKDTGEGSQFTVTLPLETPNTHNNNERP